MALAPPQARSSGLQRSASSGPGASAGELGHGAAGGEIGDAGEGEGDAGRDRQAERGQARELGGAAAVDGRRARLRRRRGR